MMNREEGLMLNQICKMRTNQFLIEEDLLIYWQLMEEEEVLRILELNLVLDKTRIRHNLLLYLMKTKEERLFKLPLKTRELVILTITTILLLSSKAQQGLFDNSFIFFLISLKRL